MGLYQESVVRAELYRCRPPARLKVPILVQPAAVSDDVPTELEVDLAVRGMKYGRSGGPSGMRSGDLKVWRKGENRDKEPEGRRWELAVRLMQVIFRDGTMPLKIAWVKMLLAPKWKGGVQGRRVGRDTVEVVFRGG